MAEFKNLTKPSIDKVVPIDTSKAMGFEERRVIIDNLNDVYINHTVGYMDDWTDEKLAQKLKIPRAWISRVRDENFGPEINENSTKRFTEATEWLDEMAQTLAVAESAIPTLQKLVAQGRPLEQSLRKFCENK